MSTAQDYPVTNRYNPPDHNGKDRKMDVGTSVQVGNTVIGLSGTTGKSSGPHLHTQAGPDQGCQQVVDPTPHEFQPGTVVAIRTTDPYRPGVKGGEWGKYVTIRNQSGMYVTYAHLNEVRVKVGQVIQGGTMSREQDLEGLANVRSKAIQDVQEAVGIPRHDTNTTKDIIERVRLVPGDVDNLWLDLFGVKPTQADYDMLKKGPKDFLYYFETQAKQRLGQGQTLKPGTYIVK